MKEIKREEVIPGDELPCYQENIIHTEINLGKLNIWYVENKRE